MTPRASQSAQSVPSPKPKAPTPTIRPTHRGLLRRVAPVALAVVAVTAVVVLAVAAVAYARTDVPAPGELATAQVVPKM